MKSILEYYTDGSLSKRISVNELGHPVFDWGITIPGEKKQRTFYVKNISRDKVSIRQPFSSDGDFMIKDYPVHLKSNESGIMTLEFSPGWSRTRPLKTEWGFDIIVG